MSAAPHTSQPNCLRIKHNANGIFEWSYTHMSNISITRFQRLQTQALLSPTEAPESFAACLVCLDGVRPEDLQHMQKGFQIFRSLDGDVIEWVDTKADLACRRIISPFTVLAAQHHLNEHAGQGRTLVKLFDIWLEHSKDYGHAPNPAQLVQQDQLCWLSACLPSSLFAIAAGLTPWHPVPRSALARRDSGLAIVEEKPPEDEEGVNTDLGATDFMVQAAMESLGNTHDQALLLNVLLILKKKHKSRIAGWVKRQWICDLFELSNKVGRSHPALGLAIGWVIHMCEAGTLTTPNPSLKTIRAYCRVALRKITAALVTWSTDLDAWTSDNLANLYIQLLASVKSSMKGNMASALGCFHAYLVEWFDMDPLAIRLHQHVEQGNVAANVVWPHESELAIQWALPCPDERMGQITACMLAIATEQGVRLQDLRRLNLRNIQFHDSTTGRYATLEIVKDARRGSLKTDNAQRRIVIRDPRSVNLLESWHARRLKELALMKSPLFGDAQHDHQLYKPAQVHAFANRLLKAVTGCPSIRFHHLRHSAISAQTDKILRSCTTVDINQLEELACRSGHGTPQTTLITYSHLHEQAMRLWLDLAVIERLELTGQQAEKLTGVKANTLSQMRRRQGRTRLKLVWDHMAQMAASVPLEPSTLPFGLCTPSAPEMKPWQARQITPAVVADALLRHIDGEPDTKLAILLGMDTVQVSQWLKECKAYLEQRFVAQHPRRRLPAAHGIAEMLKELGVKPELLFSARSQTLTSRLSGQVDESLLKGALASWEQCVHGHFISLVHPVKARALFTFLKTIGFNARCPRIVLQKDPPPRNPPIKRPPAAEVQMENERVFKQEFGLLPICERTEYRNDRPMAYLVLNPDPKSPTTPNAQSITPCLNIWLIVCQAYLFAHKTVQST